MVMMGMALALTAIFVPVDLEDFAASVSEVTALVSVFYVSHHEYLTARMFALTLKAVTTVEMLFTRYGKPYTEIV